MSVKTSGSISGGMGEWIPGFGRAANRSGWAPVRGSNVLGTGSSPGSRVLHARSPRVLPLSCVEKYFST